MSTVIELEFETQIDLDFIEQGIAVHLIRLTASVQLQTTEGWTKKYKALVDTGNPISIIPNSVWRKSQDKPGSLRQKRRAWYWGRKSLREVRGSHFVVGR